MEKKLLALLALVSLAACSGAHSNGLGATPPVPSSQPSTAPTDLSFVVDIPVSQPQTAARRPHYVSASTQSLAISLQGGATLGTFDVSSTSKLCATTSSGRTCTIGVNAPQGADTFTIKAYDEPDGSGNLLESGNVAQTVSSSGSSVNVSVQLNGVPSKYAILIGNASGTGGTPSSTTISLQAFDVDGHVIIGPYDRTITLQDSDTTGATKLSGSTSISDSSAQATLSYDGSPFRTATITAVIPNMQPQTATFTVTPGVTQVNAVNPVAEADGSMTSAGATGAAMGPDGNIWAAGAVAGAIVRITPQNVQTSFVVPTPYSFPQEIVAGKDGAMWFTETSGNNIGRITTSGKITEYPIPTQWADPLGIACGPDGTIWFAESGQNQIGKLDPATGTITEFVIPGSFVLPNDLTIGPDGNVWIDTASAIIVISQSGAAVANYPLSHKMAGAYGITTGVDGNLWFGEYGQPYLARITPSGTLTEFRTPDPNPSIMVISNGPDGNIWFGESNSGVAPNGTVGYIDPKTGKIVLVPLQIQAHVRGLMFDSHNNLWFTGFIQASSAVGEVVY